MASRGVKQMASRGVGTSAGFRDSNERIAIRSHFEQQAHASHKMTELAPNPPSPSSPHLRRVVRSSDA
jgi:hypothetical protein